VIAISSFTHTGTERSDGNENVNGSSIANSEIKLKSKKNMTVNEVNRYEAMRTDEVEN
jgi:hypothetical protein